MPFPMKMNIIPVFLYGTLTYIPVAPRLFFFVAQQRLLHTLHLQILRSNPIASRKWLPYRPIKGMQLKEYLLLDFMHTKFTYLLVR